MAGDSGKPQARPLGEAIDAIRIKAPTRGNRRLEALLGAANADPQLKAWWHAAQVNAERLGMSDHSWIHVQIVLNIALRIFRLLHRRGLEPAGRGLPQHIPLSPRAVTETTLSKKRAFDGEVAIAVAQLNLVRMLQRTLPAGFIAPCLPTKTDKLPSGGLWLHELAAARYAAACTRG